MSTRRISLDKVLKDIPLRCTLTAVCLAVLYRLLPWDWLSPQLHGWYQLLLKLVFVYTALRLLAWLSFDCPAAVGAWRGPSKILRDLGLLVSTAGISVVLVQQHTKINVVGLLTTSAVLTVVIGLAAQETLKDMFAGISLQLDPPFREGDWIELGQARGTVKQLTLMNTHLNAMDGGQVVIANSAVAMATLRRFRPSDPVGNRFSLGLDYGLPPSEALALLRKVLDLHPRVLSHPQAKAWVSAYDDSSITYEILAFQSQAGDYPSFELRSELLEQIWYALERIGQTVPFPVMEIRRHSGLGSIGEHDFSQAGAVERAALLSTNPLLGSLNSVQLKQLAGVARRLRFAQSEVIVREGDSGDALFQIISGCVEVLKQDPYGLQFPVTQLGPGDVFGEMTLCVNEPRNATVRALDQVVLLEIEGADLQPLIEEDPSLIEAIATLVSERRSELDHLSKGSKEQRENLIRRMKQRFKAMASSG